MSKQEVATTTTNTSLPAHLQARIKQDAGKGVSKDASDNIVPLVYILQALSPAVNARNPDYVQGAVVGDILLKHAPQPLIKGEEGFLFQPCYFEKEFVEWVVRSAGGGFVGRHAEMPADVKEVPDEKNPNKKKYIRANGNEIIETRYHIGFVIQPDKAPMPYVIPMSSSGHTISRQFMFLMGTKMIGNDVAPSYAGLYRFTTKERTKGADTWMTWSIKDEGWVQSEDDYNRGAALFAAFESKSLSVDKNDAVNHAQQEKSTPTNDGEM